MSTYTGYKRSLTVVVTKYVNGTIVIGYPITYNGQLPFIYNDSNYFAISNYSLSVMAQDDYLDRLTDFKAYVSDLESIIDFNENIVSGKEPYLESTLECVPPTTTTTTTIQGFLMCINAGLHFDTYSTGLIGVLTVGNLIGNEGVTIGNYLIEWRLGSNTGEIVFISGIGTDPLLQALHPFINEPVVSGILYPVIKYIQIDGEVYTPYLDLVKSEGYKYSPDIVDCLPEPGVNIIEVLVLDCNTVNDNDKFPIYSYGVSYSNNTDPAINAERILSFNLNEDGNTNYFAFSFVAELVADRITISYVSTLDPNTPTILEDWIVGYNLSADNFDSLPYRYKSWELSKVLDLTSISYNIGDYLLIHIVPRIQEPDNVNTNWTLFIKCLESINLPQLPRGWNAIDKSTINMVWDGANCQYDLSYNTVVPYGFEDLYAYNPTTYIYETDYIYFNNYTYQGGWIPGSSSQSTQHLFFTRSINYTFNRTYGGSCQNSISTITIARNTLAHTILLTFNDINDFNLYRTKYNNVLASTQYLRYTEDVTSIRHYMGWELSFFISPTGCGDSLTSESSYISFKSTFTWDEGAKTLLINVIDSSINGIVEAVCNNSYSIVNQRITEYHNEYINHGGVNSSKVTHSSATTPFSLYIDNDAQMSGSTTGLYEAMIGIATHVIDTFPLGDQWKLTNSILNQYPSGLVAYKMLTYIVITNNIDPINNFELWTGIGEDGLVISADSPDYLPSYILVYKIVDGNSITITTTTSTTRLTATTTSHLPITTSTTTTHCTLSSLYLENYGGNINVTSGVPIGWMLPTVGTIGEVINKWTIKNSGVPGATYGTFTNTDAIAGDIFFATSEIGLVSYEIYPWSGGCISLEPSYLDVNIYPL